MNKNAFLVALLISFILGILTAVVASRAGPNPGGETVINESARQPAVYQLSPAVKIPVVFGWPIHPEDYKEPSSPFADRDPATVGGHGDNYHNGGDGYGVYHARILAAADGKVVCHFVPPGGKWDGHKIFGGLLIIEHYFNGEIWYTVYGHLSETEVNEGDIVSMGQFIARQGATGETDSEHLHIETIQGGTLNVKTGEITGGIYHNPFTLMEEPLQIRI